MYSNLLIVLLPLFIGYLFHLTSATMLKWVNKLLGSMVYVILFFMGISLAFLDNLSANLFLMVKYLTVTAFCILSINLLGLLLLERHSPWQLKQRQGLRISRWSLVLESLKLCGVVVIGFVLGLSEWQPLHYATKGSQLALIFLLFLVGIQLRSSGMTLRQLALNRRGVVIALVAAVSSLIGGVFAALILALPISTGLALASGYGWYSLSGIVLTESLGPLIGSTAFFNDLVRELVAILFIPALIHRGRNVALGMCGSTSIDFTLPVLQRCGGVEMVPPAIVHGFVLSLLSPILMGIFAA